MLKEHPTILAIETSTLCCSVALLCNRQRTELFEMGNNIHSKVLLSMVQQLLKQADVGVQELDAIAAGQGPGSFTGLRIGVGVAQGLAYGANCPMVGIASLDALAKLGLSDLSLPELNDESVSIIAGIDARMGEIYWAEYQVQSSLELSCGGMQVTPPLEVQSTNDRVLLIGNAWPEYWSELSPDLVEKAQRIDIAQVRYPLASSVLELAEKQYLDAQTIDAMSFAPIYIRNDIAKKSQKPLPGNRV